MLMKFADNINWKVLGQACGPRTLWKPTLKRLEIAEKKENEISLGKDRPIPFFEAGRGEGWLERE